MLPLVLLALLPAALAASEGGAGSLTHRMMLLAIQVGVILFAAKLGNVLAEKVHLPGALGELLVGALIGAYLLGGLPLPGFPHGLFPMDGRLPVRPELAGFSMLASVVLLFHIGLETDLKLLLRYALAGGLAGMGGMVASFFLGAGVMTALSGWLWGESLGLFSPPCLMLGTITTATSVGITARILSERRQLDSPEGVTILSAAVIDDVLGIILLAVVMSFIAAQRKAGGEGIDWGHIGMVAVKAVGVWLAATAAGLVLSRKISWFLKHFRDRTVIAVMALGLALILAGLFEEAGLAMIIGAYVMGLSLSQADIAHVVREKTHAIYVLLVPLFFCVTGMHINLRALTDFRVLVFGLAYAAAAMAAKVLGCGLPSLLAGFTLRGAARIGFGMSPRCEVALIIAGVAMTAGVLGEQGQHVLAAVIVMVVVNTVVAPPVLVLLFRDGVRGTRRAVRAKQDTVMVPFDFPTQETADFLVGVLDRLFEQEGYFAHCLDRRRHHYQFRKDDAVIEFVRSGNRLEFSCRPEQESLVGAVMYEALAEMEHLLKSLREPLDAADIRGRLLADETGCGPAGFRFRNVLLPELIRVPLVGRTKAEIIDELLGLLAAPGILRDIDAARRAVWEREESMSTGLQYGVAIPHGRTDAVDRLVCAVGLAPAGVDFAALDGEPSTIFLLTLSPTNRPAPHLQFMSAVSGLLDEAGRERLLACRNERQVYRFFCGDVPIPVTPTARRQVTHGVAAAARSPADYLRPEQVVPTLAATDKEGAIRELVATLAATGAVADADAVLAAVLEREAQRPTGLEKGIALPHGRTGAVEGLVCALGRAPAGIDFGAADGKPSRLIILVVTPPGGVDPYLPFVAWALKALDEPGRRAVAAAGSAGEICAILRGDTGPAGP